MYKRQVLATSLQVVAFPALFALVQSAELDCFLTPPFLCHSLTSHLALNPRISICLSLGCCLEPLPSWWESGLGGLIFNMSVPKFVSQLCLRSRCESTDFPGSPSGKYAWSALLLIAQLEAFPAEIVPQHPMLFGYHTSNLLAALAGITLLT